MSRQQHHAFILLYLVVLDAENMNADLLKSSLRSVASLSDDLHDITVIEDTDAVDSTYTIIITSPRGENKCFTKENIYTNE